MVRIGTKLTHSIDHGNLQFLKKLLGVGKFVSKKVQHKEIGGAKLSQAKIKNAEAKIEETSSNEKPRVKERTVTQNSEEGSPWKSYHKSGESRDGKVIMGAKGQKGAALDHEGLDVFFDVEEGDIDTILNNNVGRGFDPSEIDDDGDDIFYDSSDDAFHDLPEDGENVYYNQHASVTNPEETRAEQRPENTFISSSSEVGSVGEVKKREPLPDKLSTQTLDKYFKEIGQDVEVSLNDLGPLKGYGKTAYDKVSNLTIKEFENKGKDLDGFIKELLGGWTSKIALPAIRKFMPTYKADAFQMIAEWYVQSSNADHPHTEDLNRVLSTLLGHCKDNEQKVAVLHDMVNRIVQKAYDEHQITGIPSSGHYREQIKVVFVKLQHECGHDGEDRRAELSMDPYVLMACGNNRISSREL